MKNLFTNRYIDALTKTFFFIGLFHFTVLIFLAWRAGIHVLNVFTILNVGSAIPSFGNDLINCVLSYLPLLALYGLIYLRLTKSTKDRQ